MNQKRKDIAKETSILQSLQSDLARDIDAISFQVEFKEGMVNDYLRCLDILSGKIEGDKSDLEDGLKTILQVGSIDLNSTTFSNLQSTGEIRLIRKKDLADNIVRYYNTDYLNWQSALREYTRNITAPFFLSFDYHLGSDLVNIGGVRVTYPGDKSDFSKPPKTLEDYRDSYFVINILRQKTWNLKALILRYQNLLEVARSLDEEIETYLNEFG